MEVSLGQVVYSKAGRDSGRKFIIVDIIDVSNVLICDGDLRKLAKPKKKRKRHIEITNNIIADLNEKLINKVKINDSEIRKWLLVLEDNNKSTN